MRIQLMQPWKNFSPDVKWFLFALQFAIARSLLAEEVHIQIANFNLALDASDFSTVRVDKNTMKFLTPPRFCLVPNIPSRCECKCYKLFRAQTLVPQCFCIGYFVRIGKSREDGFGNSICKLPPCPDLYFMVFLGIRNVSNILPFLPSFFILND